MVMLGKMAVACCVASAMRRGGKGRCSPFSRVTTCGDPLYSVGRLLSLHVHDLAFFTLQKLERRWRGRWAHLTPTAGPTQAIKFMGDKYRSELQEILAEGIEGECFQPAEEAGRRE